MIENAYMNDALGIADRMTRKAIGDAVKTGSVSGSAYYTAADGQPLVITATFANRGIETQWTHGETQITAEQAVAGIAGRMQSRLG